MFDIRFIIIFYQPNFVSSFQVLTTFQDMFLQRKLGSKLHKEQVHA